VTEFKDEADHLKDGTASTDPKAGTKTVAAHVPLVRSVQDVLVGSATRAMSKERISQLTTGHYRLDGITGGFRPSFTWLFGADTSWGKSSFLISVCDENIRAGRTCLIVSSEDAETVYGDRLMARRSKVSATNLRDKCLTPEEMAKVLETSSKGETKPFFVAANGEESSEKSDGDATEGWPLEHLLQHLEVIVREKKVDFVAFDYLQEFTTKNRYQDERLKFKAMAGMMRRFIRKMKICGCVFSQLTVTTETKIPTRANIRECRDVANGSDVILIGFEPDADVKDREGNVMAQAGKKCIHVDKVKNGPRGAKVQMDWNGHSACFKRVQDPALQVINRMAEEHDAPYWQDL
jgi:replicative DNA helicase